MLECLYTAIRWLVLIDYYKVVSILNGLLLHSSIILGGYY